MMTRLILGLALLVPTEAWWIVQDTAVDSNLRGVSLVVHRGGVTVWATGSNGTVELSTDGGATWQKIAIPNGDALDFRAVQAFDKGVAYVMSSGEGEKSRIFKTSDLGKTWKMQYAGKRKEFFLDGLQCIDEKHCFALSDPVGGKFLLLSTEDGEHWKEMPREHMPAALAKEGAFAASNSGLLIYREKELYFGTGGSAARLFHSADLGKTWEVSETPVISGKSSQGIFSVVRAGDTIVVAGGDYSDAGNTTRNAAYSEDGGKTWTVPEERPTGYRSALDTYDAGFVAVGPNGSEISRDGTKWQHIDDANLNALAVISGKGYAVGPKGVVAKFEDHNEY
jgi:photosystem II stability/assembly factor-like uncharacterized protein